MSSVSIGITAMELFAYNPFRILGIPVNASHAEIAATYDKLLKLADTGDISSYKTPFDFDSLPPFSRSSQTIKTAHAKLASNGYRCFAYADEDFPVSLNVDDIALNLRDITCYDCFLRCYMWLIINDRELSEHALWIQLANYIDKLISSSQEEWTKYFDNRFPDEMVDDSLSAYKSFYTTFCEIILLPLKEMVRGSMKCHTAKEILECAKIDVNENIGQINIPQANAPKAGQAKPKLAKALKYGDEYFDISSGTMRPYAEDTAANESNSFTDSFSALSAEAVTATASAEDVPAPAVQKAQDVDIPARRSRRAADAAPETTDKKTTPQATQPVAPKGEPLKLDNAAVSSPSLPQQQKPQPQSQPAQPRQRRSIRTADGSQPVPPPAAQNTSFSSENPFFDLNANKVQGAQDKSGTTHRASSYTKLVEEAAKKEQEAAQAEQEAIARAEADDEDVYKNALIEMLKSSSMRNQTMQSVDTSHVVSAAEMAGPSHTTASMDNIDMRKYDEKNLTSNSGRALTREEKYRNVKIDDMLTTGGTGKNYGLTPIDEFKMAKKKEREQRRSLLLTLGITAIVLGVFVALYFTGFIG